MLNILDALPGDGQLRYYGISYGTILGWTFAQTFPARVDRMILDGEFYNCQPCSQGFGGASVENQTRAPSSP